MKDASSLIARYPILRECEEEILQAAEMMVETYRNGGKILLCGNGGSAADCEHISGELLKGFLSKRRVTDARLPLHAREALQGSLPAIPLPSLTSALTAAQNDLDPDYAYAQLLYGLAKKGDLLIAISTSGNAKNVCNAATVARALDVKVLALTGRVGGSLLSLSDASVRVPRDETYEIQELHLPVYHFLCAYTEEQLFQS